MRAVSIIGACAVSMLPLVACAEVQAVANDQSYSLPRGIASYDALAREGATCKARGGVVKPTGQGDQTMLSNYFCSIPAGAKQ